MDGSHSDTWISVGKETNEVPNRQDLLNYGVIDPFQGSQAIANGPKMLLGQQGTALVTPHGPQGPGPSLFEYSHHARLSALPIHYGNQGGEYEAIRSHSSLTSHSRATSRTTDEKASFFSTSTTYSNTENYNHRQRAGHNQKFIFDNRKGVGANSEEAEYTCTRLKMDIQDEMEYIARQNTNLYLDDEETLNPVFAPFVVAKQQHDKDTPFWEWSREKQRFYHADGNGKVVLWFPKPESFA